MKKTIVSAAASVLLAVAMCLSFCSCAVPVNANEISSDYSRRVGAAGNACESFYAPLSDFSFALLGRALDADGGNTLVSPFSVAMCLGMLANGTGGVRDRYRYAQQIDVHALRPPVRGCVQVG